MTSAIRVEGLGKKYLITHREPYRTLRDALAAKVRRLTRGARAPDAAEFPGLEEFWALRDVSFEIGEGERVGIIGRNGAGKSTLLKILSRITDPTSGRVEIRGRVASLLEVGTGFHPELTGRENIFLNGAILGMSSAEIRRKFDEIAAFSEVEKFLDTPVKRYSSGMYVRLAFAVAAHLETEILVVDEVLAVGDAQFQSKCLGKMEEMGRQGRTLLFVSHNMNAVEELCGRAILLADGRVGRNSGDVRSTIRDYLFSGGAAAAASMWSDDSGRYANPYFTPRRLAVTDGEGRAVAAPVRNDGDTWIEIEGDIERPDSALQVGYALYSEESHLVYWTCHTDRPETAWPRLQPGRWRFRSMLPRRTLNEGRYRIELLSALYYREWLSEPGVRAPSVHLDVQGGLSDSPYWRARRPGVLAPVIDWSAERR
jgi:homopolymeric O-antigen transport system ATP-binding protein